MIFYGLISLLFNFRFIVKLLKTVNYLNSLRSNTVYFISFRKFLYFPGAKRMCHKLRKLN